MRAKLALSYSLGKLSIIADINAQRGAESDCLDVVEVFVHGTADVGLRRLLKYHDILGIADRNPKCVVGNDRLRHLPQKLHIGAAETLCRRGCAAPASLSSRGRRNLK
jgi:hypothetical protein